MNYNIIKEETVYNDFFKIKKAKIIHDSFDEDKIEVNRLCFERGDSVAIVIFESDTNSILMTKQFRYPTIKETNGWIIELTAGSIEGNENPKERAEKEIEEEIGYKTTTLTFINSFFVSPGGSSERIFLYFAEVTTRDKVFKGGGMVNEKEDIKLIKIPTNTLKKKLDDNEFRDAKTIIGIQWFIMNKL